MVIYLVHSAPPRRQNCGESRYSRREEVCSVSVRQYWSPSSGPRTVRPWWSPRDCVRNRGCRRERRPRHRDRAAGPVGSAGQCADRTPRLCRRLAGKYSFRRRPAKARNERASDSSRSAPRPASRSPAATAPGAAPTAIRRRRRCLRRPEPRPRPRPRRRPPRRAPETSFSNSAYRNIIQIRFNPIRGLPAGVMRRTGTPRRNGTGRYGTRRVALTALGVVGALFGAVLVAAAPTVAAMVAVAALAVGVAWRRSAARRSGRRCLPDEACADA